MLKYTKLSTPQIKGIMECFCQDTNANKASKKLHLNRNTVNRFYGLFRCAICYYRMALLRENFAALKSINYIPSRKRWEAKINHTLIGLLMGKSGCYAEIIPPKKGVRLLQLIREQIGEKGYVFLPEKKSYDAVVDMTYNKYYSISHVQHYLLSLNATNDLLYEFWKFTRRRLLKFNGGYRAKFTLHLKECEWRYQKPFLQLKKELTIIFKAYLKKEALLKNNHKKP